MSRQNIEPDGMSLVCWINQHHVPDAFRWNDAKNGIHQVPMRVKIVTTLPLKGAGEAIEKALRNVPSAFEKVKVDWTEAESFSIHAEQKLPDAYRHCMVIGGQISASECVVCFKVVDFQPQRSVSVLGGLLTAQLTTQEDRDGTRAARFQAQAKEGAAMVMERIRRALRTP